MRADARANREQIIDAAKELFSEQGVDIAFRTIASRAEVGVATLHRHFPDRDSLINAVAEHIYDKVRFIMGSHEEEWASAPWEAWTGTVHELVALGVSPVSALVPKLGGPAHSIEDFLQVATERDLASSQQLLARAARLGFVPHCLNPYDFAIGLAAISRPLPGSSETGLSEYRVWLTDVFIDGLRAQAERK